MELHREGSAPAACAAVLFFYVLFFDELGYQVGLETNVGNV